uniref:NTR domain-containing protein n=1 Tax=Steinernema glaseri TaxID=37863 RepID=A0A1I8AVN5_9BILA
MITKNPHKRVNPRRALVFTAMFRLLIFAALVGVTFGCSCAPANPTDKQRFCGSDFVGHFKVLNRTSQPAELWLLYTVEVIDVFKSVNGHPKKGEVVEMKTRSNPDMCGVDGLEVGSEHALNGSGSSNSLNLSNCLIFRPSLWSQVTDGVKETLKNGGFEPCAKI